MKMHHPSQAVAHRVSVRTYLLAGVSVLSAGMIRRPVRLVHRRRITPWR